ncbi:MAG: protein kinase [Acidobacteriota bacterium]
MALPDRIGPYELRRPLGTGGMGEVFLAWDHRLERSVAIKRLRADLTSSPERTRRFRREARSAARLSHSAIVRVYDILEAPSGDSIVMEHVDGRTLGELLRHEGLSLSHALRLGAEISEGLAYAHDHGLIHRDLKGDNVMVTHDGHAKILDFGLVKQLDLDEPESRLTREGIAVGTLQAMSPEQARGAAVDHRSDLYSLGVLLHEMLTGGLARKVRDLPPAVRQTPWNQPVPLRAIRPELPGDLCDLVEALLESSPRNRPEDAHQVAGTLDALAARPDLPGLYSPPWESPEEPASDAPTSPEEVPGRSKAPTREADSARRPMTSRWRRPWAVFAIALAAGLLVAIATRLMLDSPGERSEDTAANLPRTPFELYQSGNALLERYDRKGYIDRAIANFSEAVAADPEFAPAYSGLGRAYWRKHRDRKDSAWLDKALESARVAVRLAPQLSHGQITLAYAQLAAGENEDARQLLESVLRLDPANAGAQRGLADLATSESRSDEAMALYREAIRMAPANAEYRGELGILLSRAGDYQGAEEAFEAALDITPDHHFLLLSLGGIYHFQGRLPEAATALQRSIEVRPSGPAYSNLGTLYFFQGRLEEAATAYRSALDLNANNYFIWANLGDVHRRIPGQEPEARNAFLRAIQLIEEELVEQPENLVLTSRLALYRARRGECPAARQQVAALQPLGERLASTAYRIALSWELCGQREAALEALEMALEGGYSFDEAQREPDLIDLREDLRFHHLALRFTSHRPAS